MEKQVASRHVLRKHMTISLDLIYEELMSVIEKMKRSVKEASSGKDALHIPGETSIHSPKRKTKRRKEEKSSIHLLHMQYVLSDTRN
jgi:hypothetical protein